MNTICCNYIHFSRFQQYPAHKQLRLQICIYFTEIQREAAPLEEMNCEWLSRPQGGFSYFYSSPSTSFISVWPHFTHSYASLDPLPLFHFLVVVSLLITQFRKIKKPGAVHMYTHTCTWSLAHKHIHMCMQSYAHTHALTHIHVHTQSHTYVRTHTHTHIDMCTQSHTHTYTYTHNSFKSHYPVSLLKYVYWFYSSSSFCPPSLHFSIVTIFPSPSLCVIDSPLFASFHRWIRLVVKFLGPRHIG